MDSSRQQDLIRMTVEAGLSAEWFDGWDGDQVALYRVGPATPARGSTIAVFDLGMRTFELTEAQFVALKQKLDAAGLPYTDRFRLTVVRSSEH
jgi:hypothetical protein